MQKNCAQCRQDFEVMDADLAFYEQVSPLIGGEKQAIPPPTLCPDCRRQRRHAFRNERNLYHRKCDKTGQQIISVYAPEREAVVYHHREWWSDGWDPRSYGREFDFSRPFFEQFAELLRAVPHMNVAVTNVQNADFCHLIGDCQNCYLVFESSHAEDCLHGYWLQKCTDCCDVSFSHECEQCYELDNCYSCNHLRWSRNCTNCSDSAFLLDCIGCKNCLFCANLRQQEYCILNKQYSKAEYEAKLEECDFGSHRGVEALRKQFETFALTQPRKYMTAVQEENCTGNYIQESRNCRSCFHAHQAEDCAYGEHVWRAAKDCMDVVTAGRGASQMYETTNTNMGAARDAFCIQCWSSNDTYYSSECCSCSDCFGSVGLRRSKYCVLNKQYSKEEYEVLVSKIIEHMRKTGEWGEFFPAAVSLFGYHETVAQEQFPLEKTQALKAGWHWSDDVDSRRDYLGPNYDVPDAIGATTDELSQNILVCAATGKPYKIIPQELEFYRSLNVPVPRKCPDQRHTERMALRNPLRLWPRECAKCKAAIQTSYAPDRPEIVYCEACYRKAVY